MVVECDIGDESSSSDDIVEIIMGVEQCGHEAYNSGSG